MDILITCLILSCMEASAFWEEPETTTEPYYSFPEPPRRSFFRWQPAEPMHLMKLFSEDVVEDQMHKRNLHTTAGVSIDQLPLGTATILSRRLLLTSHNLLAPYDTRMREVRVWALGPAGKYYTPLRYRVWRWRRIFPKSLNSEHQHGPRGEHQPRHDVAVIFTWDAMYVADNKPQSDQVAYAASITLPTTKLEPPLIMHGSGYIDYVHVNENYIINYAPMQLDWIVNCEAYLAKYWGKFVCFRNVGDYFGVPSGGGVFSGTSHILTLIGGFEIRYNDESIFAFTDLRYVVNVILVIANITPGDYYEYAYPESKNIWQRQPKEADKYLTNVEDLMWGPTRLSRKPFLQIIQGMKPHFWPYYLSNRGQYRK